jgi:serine/threonine protein kinase
VDLFAAAIVLFIMVVGTPPFTRADSKDPYYNLIIHGKMDRFWQQHLKFKADKKFFTPTFKDLLANMLQYDPSKRLSLEQVLSHPWMQEDTLT